LKKPRWLPRLKTGKNFCPGIFLNLKKIRLSLLPYASSLINLMDIWEKLLPWNINSLFRQLPFSFCQDVVNLTACE